MKSVCVGVCRAVYGVSRVLYVSMFVCVGDLHADSVCASSVCMCQRVRLVQYICIVGSVCVCVCVCVCV